MIMNIVITIPAYNEEKTIGATLKEIERVIHKNKYNAKILVVDDGSSDKTAVYARKAGVVVFSHPRNYGLAETFRTEIEKCLEMKADIIVHIDADGQYVPDEIPLLVNEVKRGTDLVLGSRFKGVIEEMPLMKRFGNRAFSVVVSNITKARISDAQTGFRAFTRKVASEIKIISDHTYTQEQIIRAIKHKFKVVEVPITFKKRIQGKSRLMSNPIDFAVKAWINILRIYRDYEPLKFFGITGMLIFGLGFLIGLWLLYLYLTIGIVGRIPSVMLAVLLMSLGFQLVIFGFLADMKKNGQ